MLTFCQYTTNFVNNVSSLPPPIKPENDKESHNKNQDPTQDDASINKILDNIDEKFRQNSKIINKINKIQILKSQNGIKFNASVIKNKVSLILYQDIEPLAIGGV